MKSGGKLLSILMLLVLVLPFVSAKPDLTILGASISHYGEPASINPYYIGDKVWLEVVIKNIGDAPAGSSWGHIAVYPSQIYGVNENQFDFFYHKYENISFPIPQEYNQTVLQPGEQMIYSDYFTINSSSFNITVEVDDDNLIDEENESNNVMSDFYIFSNAKGCYDTDGGKNLFLRGNVYKVNSSGSFYKADDFCSDNLSVAEYSCKGGDVVYETMLYCGGGGTIPCSTGRCIPEFTAMGAGIALAGAGLGYWFVRSRRKN